MVLPFRFGTGTVLNNLFAQQVDADLVSLSSATLPVNTGTITFQVNQATGNDSNDGIINPFKTIGRATLAASQYNYVSLGVPNIAVAPGTYNEQVFLPPINAYGIENYNYASCPFIYGTGPRTSQIIRPPSGTSPTISHLGGGAPWFVTTFILEPSQSSFAICCYAENGMLLIDDLTIRPNQIDNTNFGWAIFCVNHGLISHIPSGTGSTVSSGAQHFVEIETGTYWQLGVPITFTGTPNYSTAVLRGWHAHINLDSGTFSGSCTGPKFYLRYSEIQGLSTANLPGNASGDRDIGSFISYDSVNVQTASYTLSLDDLDGVVDMNVGSANTLTVPTNASVPFPVDARRRIRIVQAGAGTTTIQGAGGVTVHNAASIAAQWGSCDLSQHATNVWVATFFTSFVGGGGARVQRSIVNSGGLPIVGSDSILNINAASDLTPTVPLASGRAGAALTFKNLVTSTTQTLTRTSSDTFDGATTYILNAGSSVTLVPYNDGVNAGWAIE